MPKRHLTLYVVPDIHATNFPVGRQTINDSGAVSAAEAIFEIKTYSTCNTWYRHNNNSKVKPANRRAKLVVHNNNYNNNNNNNNNNNHSYHFYIYLIEGYTLAIHSDPRNAA